MTEAELHIEIDKIAGRWKGKEGNLIMILHDVQDRFGYVPRDVSLYLSRLIDVPLARIYEVITFYHYFKVKRPGKHIISVCLGTACYLKGAPVILSELSRLLGITEGQTTQDGQFHLQVVRCLGCCGLAPVIKIDNTVHGRLKKSDAADILSQYSEKESPSARTAAP
jgi:NADH-quinone oxidoreductase subunit E